MNWMDNRLANVRNWKIVEVAALRRLKNNNWIAKRE